MPTDPIQALRICHEQLRRGDFFPELREAVVRHDTAWKALENEARWLEGRAVASEAYDYFGDYAAAADCLSPGDPRVSKAVESEGGNDLELEKRRIYLLIALAHSSYRHERLDLAEAYLNMAQSRLDRGDPAKRRHLGTRARLAYSCGQLARNQQRFGDALDHFSACCYHASERLRRRTPELELTGPPTSHATPRPTKPDHGAPEALRRARERENDQLYTAWVIGKSLAFGMGWVHYMMGNLTAARHAVSAGYSMLRLTGDWIHRAYAQMLLASTERAQSFGQPAVIARALERIQEAENGLAPHPTFGARAAFETALTLWYAGRPEDTLQALKRVKATAGSADVGTVKTTRSMCNVLVLESRAYRSLQKEREARRASDEALRRAESFDAVMPMVHALVNSAETDIFFAGTSTELALHCFQRAERRLKQALALVVSHPNPKMEASCLLHLARTLHRLDRVSEAQDALERCRLRYGTSVEHGFLKALAADVTRELGRAAERFVVDSTEPDLALKPRIEKLTDFMIQVAMKRASTPTELARLLDIDPRTLTGYLGRPRSKD